MTQALPPEPGAYLDALRRALSDLPAGERDDLLLDVEASITEAASDSTEGLLARFGPPDRFAAELRSAAGIPLRAAPTQPESGALRAVERVVSRLGSSPIVARARLALRELAPVWWLVRGYAACAVLLVAVGGHWDLLRPFVPLFGSPELGAAIVVVAAIASVTAGFYARHHGPRGRRRTGWAALNVGLAIVAVPALIHAVKAPIQSEQITLAVPPRILTPPLRVNLAPAARRSRPGSGTR